MERKENCWEFKRCGRQKGGDKCDLLGVCPATTDDRLDGVHEGVNAGRACWLVAGTMCGGEVQGTFAKKMKNCMKCDFYLKVKKEERGNFQMSATLLIKLEGD
ncbi:MAG: hypothetical protein P8Y85_02330 [Nitrospirota bacterium]